jgi:hypothetical protein
LHSAKEWKKVEYESARDFSADVTVEVGAVRKADAVDAWPTCASPVKPKQSSRCFAASSTTTRQFIE